ncbi:MAG: hypothetical protein ABWY45_17460 [Mycobacterium sp.]
MGALAYFVQLSEVGRDAFAGSQSAYLVVAPVLAGLVASGYSHPPRGVIDAESDWIGAVLLSLGGFAGIWLLESRLPTMAALWHLDNIGLLIWVAACGMVVFSARHVLQMWKVWAIGLLLAPVMPFLLLTAQLGGSDTAIALVSALLGTAAVYLAARFVGVRPRLLAALANLVLSTGAVLLLADTSLYFRVVIAAGAVPLLVVLSLHRFTSAKRTSTVPALGSMLPQCKPQSYVALFVAAVALLCVQLPITRPATVDEVRADWIQVAGLEPREDFPFITRFLGADATLTRYGLPNGAGEYPTVVDVMTSPDLARLQDYSDAVWYPSPTPVNYSSFDAVPDAPSGSKTTHSDADSAKNEDTSNWNAVTWLWRSGNIFQRVTVITSQSRDLAAPAPRPLSIHNALVQPALWVLRQQPLEPGVVETGVSDSTDRVTERLITSGEPSSAGDLAP